MRFRTLAICALAALAVVACRKRGGGSEELDTKQIAIVTSIDGQQIANGETGSKAIADATTILSDIQILRVDGQAGQNQENTSFAAAELFSGSRVAGANQPIAFNGDAPVYDVATDQTAYFMAYHPIGTQSPRVSNTWTAVDGATDILVSHFYSAGSYTAKETGQMRFSHALARLEIILEARQGVNLDDVQTKWGTITEITVDNVQPNLVFDYATTKTTPSGTATATTLLKGENYTVGAADVSADGVIGAFGNQQVKFASMLVPTGSPNIVVNVKNSTSNAWSNLSGTLSSEFEAGKIYTFRVTFGIESNDIVISNSSIIDWATGETIGGSLPNPPAFVTYIQVNGVKWAAGNLIADGANGAKIGQPEDGGLYFKFGSLVGWAGGAAGDGVGVPADGMPTTPALAVQVKPATYGGTEVWTTAGSYTGGTTGELLPATDDAATGIGDPCRYYLKGTWRLPTREEYKALIPSQTIDSPTSKFYWSSVKKGGYANAPSSTADANSLFFPAAGSLANTDGSIRTVGSSARYWGESVSSATGGYGLEFTNGNVYPGNSIYRHYGCVVRCVSAPMLSSDKVENTVPTAAGTFNLTVAGMNGEGWTLTETTDASAAFTPSTTSGNGNGTITITVTENMTEEIREASYTLTGSSGLKTTITLKQNGITITIKNLKWAVGNLIADGANGARVGAPTDGGLYFKFGSLIGWAGGATGDGVGVPADGTPTTPALAVQVKPATYVGTEVWATSGYYAGGTTMGELLPATDDAATGIGDPCRYYLKGTWRLPTREEYKALIPSADMNTASSKFYWSSANKGGYANAPSSTADANSLFFLAAGSRNNNIGSINDVGGIGYYWSASVNDFNSGCRLNFTTASVNPEGYYSRRTGLGVRCVHQ